MSRGNDTQQATNFHIEVDQTVQDYSKISGNQDKEIQRLHKMLEFEMHNKDSGTAMGSD